MRRRRGSVDVGALREDLIGMCAVVYYAAALGSDRDSVVGYDRVLDVAERVGLPGPPALVDVMGRPALIDEWAADCGLINRNEVHGGRVHRG